MTYYITTAIDYPNGKPHIGHAYEKVLADFFAKFKRIVGEDVFLQVGLDEHGQKIQETAQAKNQTPQVFVDEMAVIFDNFYKELCVEYDNFVRTSNSEHKKQVQEIFSKVEAKGDIYLGNYEGNYCVPCETFWTDLQLLENGDCPSCNRPTRKVSEPSYFFKMGKYVDAVLEHIEKNDYIKPKSRKQEILNRIKEGVRDISVSRSTFDWGIPLPSDETHVMYVWFDALLNYYTGPKSCGKKDEEFWPASCHVIGKDIQWFHTTIWLSILKAADLELPKHVLIHGFINDKNGVKMSKSLGNVVDPLALVDQYGLDAFRYYVLRAFPLDSDCKFNEAELVERYNNELGNDFGNLLLRIIKLSKKYFDGKLSNKEGNEFENPFELELKIEKIRGYLDNYQPNKAIDVIWSLLNDANKYMNEKEPWKNEESREEVLYQCAEIVRIVSIFLDAVMPKASREALELLGTDEKSLAFGRGNFSFEKETVLFPRIEYEAPEEYMFDLRVGQIKSVENHPEADKLYVIKVDIGSEVRQLVAGMKSYYSVEELEEKKIIVLCNLKKAKLRGVESQGMMLAADNGVEGDGAVVGIMTTTANVGEQVSPQGVVISTKQIDYKEFSKHEFVTGDDTMHVYGVAVSARKDHIVAEKLGSGQKIR